eukprot:8244050-Alexandrium_andersonii.AAC.1
MEAIAERKSGLGGGMQFTKERVWECKLCGERVCVCVCVSFDHPKRDKQLHDLRAKHVERVHPGLQGTLCGGTGPPRGPLQDYDMLKDDEVGWRCPVPN